MDGMVHISEFLTNYRNIHPSKLQVRTYEFESEEDLFPEDKE